MPASNPSASVPSVRLVGTSKKVAAVLILAVFLVNTLLATLAIHHLHDSRNRIDDQVLVRTQNLTSLLERGLSASTRSIDLVLLRLADELASAQATSGRDGPQLDQRVEALLMRLSQQVPEVEHFRISNREGLVRWGQGADRAHPVSWADRDFFQAHQAQPGQRLIISEPLFGRVSKQWLVSFSRSYRLADGRLAGVISAAVPIPYFQSLLSGMDLGPQGTVVIRHENQSLVSRYPPLAGPGGEIGNTQVAPIFKTHIASGKAHQTFNTVSAVDGVYRLYSLRSVPGTPMVVAVGLSPEDYLQAWHDEVRNAVLLLAAFFLLTLAAAWLAARAWRTHLRDAEALARSHDLLETRVAERTRAMTEALERLGVSEERYAYAMEAAHDGIWDRNLKTNKTYINPAYARMLGYSPEELGDDAQDLFMNLLHPEDRERMFTHVREQYAQSGSCECEFRLRAKAGHYVWVLSRGKVVERDAEGAPLRAVGTHVDLSAVKHKENELRAAKELAETASKAKSTFLANMSHELKTPLNGIMGMTSLALRRATDPRQIHQLEKAMVSAERLLDNIDDILDISKIEAGRMTIEHTRFQLTQVLENLLTLVGQKARDRGLQLEWRLTEPLGEQVFLGDPQRLGQILLNLTANAIKFTDSGGIDISARLTVEDAQGCLIRWEVKDTGIGIDTQAQGRLFTAFEQVDNSSTRHYGGSGLGLVISKRLANLMGGEIGVKSAPGQGSTFWFTVRLGRDGHADTPAAPTQEAVALAPARN